MRWTARKEANGRKKKRKEMWRKDKNLSKRENMNRRIHKKREMERENKNPAQWHEWNK